MNQPTSKMTKITFGAITQKKNSVPRTLVLDSVLDSGFNTLTLNTNGFRSAKNMANFVALCNLVDPNAILFLLSGFQFIQTSDQFPS